MLLRFSTTIKLLHISNPKPIQTLSLFTPKMSSWECKKCTFLNPKPTSSPKPTCQICLSSPSPPQSPSSSSSSSAAPKWACKACTFLNPYKRSTCQVCVTRAPISTVDDDDDGQVGSVFLPLQRCKMKRVDDNDSVQVEKGSAALYGFGGVKVSDQKKALISESTSSGSSGMGLNTLKVLTYNVWFREDLEMHKRMKAIGDLVLQHSPDVICFQEVTPDIYDIFRQANWWKMYQCSIKNQTEISQPYFCMQLSKLQVKAFSCRPFSYTAMGREICITEVQVQGNKPLVVATSHLESPCPGPPKWDQMYSKERVDQAKEALNFLKKNPNVIFCGDMNWDDKLDGQLPLPDNWIDAWEELHPGEDGFTYDTKSNQMLTGNRSLRKRLDRFCCYLRDFRVSKVEMIGTKSIPGLSYIKEKKVKGEIKKVELPVLPSDHYGLLLTICGQ